MEVISSWCIDLYAVYIAYKNKYEEKTINKKWKFPAVGYAPHWFGSTVDIIRLLNIVNTINNIVMDIENIFIMLFAFVLIKSNKKNNEKTGIRIIPIKPKCDKI